MRIINLVDPSEAKHTQQAVQTISKCIDTFISIGCAQVLAHWLSERLLYLNIAQQPHGIPGLCAVLIKADPPILQRAYILYHLVNCLRSDVSPIVLEQIPQMGLEDVALVSKPTIEALQKLVKNAEFSSRAVRVAALLSLDNPDAENILLSILENRAIEIDLPSLILSINALCILILERADAQLLDSLLKLVLKHNQASGILPIMCPNLLAATKLGFQARLVEALEYGVDMVQEKKTLNDMKWQLCSLAIQEKPHKSWRSIIDKLDAENDVFLEGFLTILSLQYPLPMFPITQWNSLELQVPANEQQKVLENTVFMKQESAILSFEKPSDTTIRFTTRTVVGRHSWTIDEEKDQPRTNPNISEWLNNLATESNFNRHVSARRKSSGLMGTMQDPFQEIPIYNPPANERVTNVDSSDVLAFIKNSARRPFGVQESSDEIRKSNVSTSDLGPCLDQNLHIWRHFAADLQLLKTTQCAPAHFLREVRHLDNTLCREVHKVAVIFVGQGQEDKQSILSNTSGSEHFNCFIEGLGWPITTGPTHLGYSGGLPPGQTAPYYATADTELIYHVSIMLNGDPQMRLKHLGNDEVHVVWTENNKPYKRDVIATRFCDVLIVLYPVSAVLIRVHIETQNPLLQFGPLFDGAYVHTKQIASLVRDTVLNASRAYRIAQQDCDRPNKHREKVFQQTQKHLTELYPSTSITSLYVPSLKS
uniref:Rap-GAP domain-containing protein n=1 Tax=Acrobeloides nanus TaxID=290746 RepID=A0A914BZM8_9BILA